MSLFNFFKKNETTNTQKSYYNQQKIQLPVDFAQKVMQLQMQTQFQQSCDIEVVQQLNQLYRIAIQYYSTIDAKRAQHFHRKLTALLTNPITIDMMQKKQHQNEVKSQYHIDSTSYKNNLRKELHNFDSQSGVVVKSIIQGNAKKLQQHNRLIDKNLQKQQDNLKRRIEERSRSKNKRKL